MERLPPIKLWQAVGWLVPPTFLSPDCYSRPTMGGDNHNIANNFHSEFDTNFQLTAEDEKWREIFSEMKCVNYFLIITI